MSRQNPFIIRHLLLALPVSVILHTRLLTFFLLRIEEPRLRRDVVKLGEDCPYDAVAQRQDLRYIEYEAFLGEVVHFNPWTDIGSRKSENKFSAGQQGCFRINFSFFMRLSYLLIC